VAKDADVLDPERFGFHLSRRNVGCRVGDDACLHCLLYPQCNHEEITRELFILVPISNRNIIKLN
jgi:hypothetical protein